MYVCCSNLIFKSLGYENLGLASLTWKLKLMEGPWLALVTFEILASKGRVLVPGNAPPCAIFW